ncbi:MAG: hypothetical protein ACRDLV_14070, partial [Solirubrobacteraceae bacterium]
MPNATNLLLADAQGAMAQARAPKLKQRFRGRVPRALAHGLPRQARQVPAGLLRRALSAADRRASAAEPGERMAPAAAVPH